MAHSDIDLKNPLRRRIGAVVIVLDPDDRVLLVKPTYKEGWQLPGGGVHAGESVADAAARELKKETGLIRRITHFVGLDQVPANPETGAAEGYNVVCFADTLSDNEARSVSVLAETAHELSECRFVGADDLDDYAFPYQARRIREALSAIKRGQELPLLVYGEPVPVTAG